MEFYYASALKAGKKEYQKRLSKGWYPYLPALDDMISTQKSDMGKDIGIVQIPIDHIVGTKTAGRKQVFASNFMPIAPERSEFADKWEILCQSHLKEGIREPIKVYEYLNRFYVLEGNKRVSVLKFFDAVTIPAKVYRIMPERNGDKAIELYYEFIDFYRYSKVNFIEFSKSGSYIELNTLLGKEKEEAWTEDEVRAFRSTYYYFEKVYHKRGGWKLKSTVGDALLAYIRIYGYEDLRGMSERQMEHAVTKVWEEITLQQEEQPIDIKLDPTEEKKSLLNIITGTRNLKVAFLYTKTVETSGWAYSHELGRNHAQKVFDGKIETKVYDNVKKDQAYEVMQKAIAEGAKVIFATSTEMLNACLKIAIEYPNVAVLNCALNKPHRYVRSYHIRMYEVKFITGAIAGVLCDNNKIGYVSKYPIYGSIAEINAFARGVQLTNSDAKIYLKWTNENNIRDVVKELYYEGIDLISFRDFVKMNESEKFLFGLAKVSKDGLDHLALPMWNWGVYYEKIIQSVLNGTYFTEQDKTKKSLNYYWGLSSGAAEMIFSGHLPKGVRYLGETLAKAIRTGICQPFYNPSTTADGRIAWDTQDQTIRLEDILSMDWLEDNVVGSIPKYEELQDDVKEVVDMIGVDTARKDSKKG